MDRDALTNRVLVRVTRFAALSILAGLAGCGGNQDAREMKLSEKGRFSSIVGEVGEAAEDDQRFEALFAQGAAPPTTERSKYGPNMKFVLVGEPEITGDTATLTVKVVQVDPATEQETAVGEVQWTAVQKDDWWYLKTVPLP